MISAKVLCDSLNSKNDRLTTLQVKFHRYILPEVLTHRVLSRNAQSSRAYPVKKLIQSVLDDPAIPVYWGENRPGMVAGKEIDVDVQSIVIPDKVSREQAWLESRDMAVKVALNYAEAGYHKQVVNRIIEPYTWTNMVISATNWDNFFALRDHPDAQPEIRELAVKIKLAMEKSTPRLLQKHELHLPYITEEESYLPDYVKRKVSVARCARVSYRLYETEINSTVEKDVELYNRLKAEAHLSPFEHVAWEAEDFDYTANFSGFTQLRSSIEEELYFESENKNAAK